MVGKSVIARIGGIAIFWLLSSQVIATPCTGVNIGTSATTDVNLNGNNSTQCEIVAGNSGMGGGDLALIPADGAFGGGTWTQIGSDGSIINAGPFSGVTFTGFSFTGSGAQSGTWGLTWTGGPAGFDIVFSMHAGGYSGYFVFSDLLLPSDSSGAGTWLIHWFNSSGENPGDESNVQIWIRADNDPRQIVPEPSSLALFALALVGLGWMRRHSKQSALRL